MKIGHIGALAAMAFAIMAGARVHANEPAATGIRLDRMPEELETRLALSALPPHLRERSSVYLLDPAKGYRLAREGTSGVACIVQRTVWELADYRDDIYIPLCYDATGRKTYLTVIMDAAALRAQGLSPAGLKTEIERRYADGRYGVPQKDGLSYMLAPVMRTIGPPDLQVHTMAMPHFMFYAPGLTNADIGAAPDLGDASSLLYPFIDRQGNSEQSYMIQLVGAAEKAKILAEEKPLIDALCAYRAVLCLAQQDHGHAQ